MAFCGDCWSAKSRSLGHFINFVGGKGEKGKKEKEKKPATGRSAKFHKSSGDIYIYSVYIYIYIYIYIYMYIPGIRTRASSMYLKNVMKLAILIMYKKGIIKKKLAK